MSTQRFAYRETIDIVQLAAAADDYEGDARGRFTPLDLAWADGTTAGKADLHWADFQRSLADSTDDDLDLDALTGGPGGATVSCAEVRAILIKAVDGDLTMGGAPTNVWTALLASGDVMQLKQGVDLRVICPTDGEYPVSGSNKILRISNNSGATVLYNIVIIGTSA